ncbi:MAG: hypothetical protein K9K67_15385 [Bacteriovoracaceae bacterium]|nr:hypothetical protein [Bacteriovoracaceae bacterium]
MFYLGTFFRILFGKPLLASLWALSITGLIYTSFFQKNLTKLMGAKVVEKRNPYFYAVMPSDINTSYIKRKLVDIPGVESVSLMAKEQINEQVKAVLESTNLDWEGDLVDLNFAGIKVNLSPDLKGRSTDLIRNYLTRLTGDKDVTLGAIKKPIENEAGSSVTYSFSSFYRYFPIIFLSLYILMLFLLRDALGNESFLIETYQRKSKVFEKCLFYGQLPIMGLLVASSLLQGRWGVVYLLSFFGGMSLIFIRIKNVKQWN